MVKLEKIKVIYHQNTPLAKVVLNDFNLQIDDGEFVAITGGNGAGKSTIAKLIAGEIPICSGTIFINHQDCTKLGVVERSSMIARVFQDPMRGTAPELTVLENMAFAAKRGTKRRLSLAINCNIRDYFAAKLHPKCEWIVVNQVLKPIKVGRTHCCNYFQLALPFQKSKL